jgi:hypothetical protein
MVQRRQRGESKRRCRAGISSVDDLEELNCR